jgi:hypothetical protein
MKQPDTRRITQTLERARIVKLFPVDAVVIGLSSGWLIVGGSDYWQERAAQCATDRARESTDG